MKDFSEVLDESEKNINKKLDKTQIFQEINHIPTAYNYQYIRNKVIKYASPFIMAIFTTPFNTASMLLQISDKSITDPLKKKIELVKNTKGKIQSLVKLGIFGDNKIYQPASYNGYGDCLRQMGKQGVKGLYKGALTGIIFSVFNTNLRTILYEETIKLTKEKQIWKKNIFTVVTCSLADFLTLPLMMCQSRLVFQNSINNFRTYKTPLNILRQVGFKTLWAGGSLIILKNILFSYSWLSFFKQSPVYSFIFSTVLSHVTVYPFLTVMRQLQCNEKGKAMMHQRQQNVRDVLKRIWRTQKFLGFYRGFLGYSLVHSFLGFIVVESNLKSGYFEQLQK